MLGTDAGLCSVSRARFPALNCGERGPELGPEPDQQEGRWGSDHEVPASSLRRGQSAAGTAHDFPGAEGETPARGAPGRSRRALSPAGSAAAGVSGPRQHLGTLVKGHHLSEQSCLQTGLWELLSEEDPVSVHRRDMWQVPSRPPPPSPEPGSREAQTLAGHTVRGFALAAGLWREPLPPRRPWFSSVSRQSQVLPGVFNPSLFLSVLRSEASWALSQEC